MDEKDIDTLYWIKFRKLGGKVKLPNPYASPKFGNTKEGLANRKAVDEFIEKNKNKK